MAFELFGFKIGKIEDEVKQAIAIPSFAPKPNEDGAVEIAPGGSYGTYIDLESTVKNEVQLVTRYRQMAQQPDIDLAITDIINEAIINDKNSLPVSINLDKLKQPQRVKTKITEEFEKILTLLDFQNMAHDIFQRWYVDGRIYYHMMIDHTKPREGIKELRYIDPRRMQKVRIPISDRNKPASPSTQLPTAAVFQEYYLYNKGGIVNTGTVSQGVRISADSICHVHSGLLDERNHMVFSHLHKAIKPYNQLRMLEDATVVYRLARAPERRIFYIDVGNLPKMKAEQYLRDMMVKHKNRLVYDATTGEVRDDRKFMCYALDTKIPLLDGRTLTLQTLIDEYESGKQNWVYSCDPNTGKFAPGPVSWAGVTKNNSQVVKVTFDNGKSVICTPDHKFPVWGKGFVEAQHIVGESIIPGYRRMKTMFGNDSDYEQIFKNETKTWEYTHRIVARWKDEANIREEKLHRIEHSNDPKKTIHHQDYNRLNNNPFNLVMMNRDDHMKFHWDSSKFGMNRRPNRSEDFTPEWRQKLSEKRKGQVQHCKTWKIFKPDGTEELVENLNEYCRQNALNRSNIKYKQSKGYKAELLTNHKAVSVEWMHDKIDVGCITVDKDEQYHSNHTYLLDVGVYTKNTMLEDYWLPRREGNRGTEITTLPGGQNLGQLDDVEYFRKKLYQSLNVPISRMLSESTFNMGRSSEISRDEIKFTKLIARLRSRFSHMFDVILETQLVLTGVMSKAEWKEIKDFIFYDFLEDNYYSELKEQEIMTQRFNILQVAEGFNGKYFSQEWIRKNILRFSDDEIDKINNQMSSEQEAAAAAQPEQPANDQPKPLREPTGEQPPQSPQPPASQPPQQAKPIPKPAAKEEFDEKPMTKEELELIENMSKLIENLNNENEDDLQDDK